MRGRKNYESWNSWGNKDQRNIERNMGKEKECKHIRKGGRQKEIKSKMKQKEEQQERNAEKKKNRKK